MEGLLVLRESKCRLVSKRPLNPIKQYVQNIKKTASITVVNDQEVQ